MNTSEPNWVAKIAALEAKLGREANLNELLVLARGHYMTDEEIEEIFAMLRPGVPSCTPTCTKMA